MAAAMIGRAALSAAAANLAVKCDAAANLEVRHGKVP